MHGRGFAADEARCMLAAVMRFPGRRLVLWAKRAFAIALAALVAVIGGAYLLPQQVSVVRTTEVAARRAAVFALVSDLRRFRQWAPWLAEAPDIAVVFTGPVEGVGQTMEWTSTRPTVASGRQTVTGVEPDSAVTMELKLADESPVSTWLGVRSESETTVVTWGMATDLGASPLARYLGLWTQGSVGPELESGLARLKALAEAGDDAE